MSKTKNSSLLQKRRTIRISREEAKKLKSNGVRISKAETPESITLSIDSLHNRRKSGPDPAPVWTSPKSGDSLILVPEPPPPVPPHKAPIPQPRPRSSMSSGRKCASREDLTDRVPFNAMSDRALHRSVGSELPKLADHYCQWQKQQQQPATKQQLKQQQQQQQIKSVKSPSSSDSSRKRRGVTTLSTSNHRDPWAVTVAPHYPSSSRKEELSSPGWLG